MLKSDIFDAGQQDEVRSLQTYLCNNRERLFTGLAIGSGVVEGACKNLVRRRLKQTGACWRLRKAEKMTVLSCVPLSIPTNGNTAGSPHNSTKSFMQPSLFLGLGTLSDQNVSATVNLVPEQWSPELKGKSVKVIDLERFQEILPNAAGNYTFPLEAVSGKMLMIVKGE